MLSLAPAFFLPVDPALFLTLLCLSMISSIVLLNAKNASVSSAKKMVLSPSDQRPNASRDCFIVYYVASSVRSTELSSSHRAEYVPPHQQFRGLMPHQQKSLVSVTRNSCICAPAA